MKNDGAVLQFKIVSTLSLTKSSKKIERLSLATLFIRVRYMRVRPEIFPRAPLQGRLLALPGNIRSGWKGLPVTDTLAYFASQPVKK